MEKGIGVHTCRVNVRKYSSVNIIDYDSSKIYMKKKIASKTIITLTAIYWIHFLFITLLISKKLRPLLNYVLEYGYKVFVLIQSQIVSGFSISVQFF